MSIRCKADYFLLGTVVNINTKEYWERRFATGDWEAKLGRNQTRLFAQSQVRYLKIPSDFPGTILDFGCGLGDAMPVYRATYTFASLIGMDISEAAIAECRNKYGNIAQFVRGTYTDVPNVDVIIASNVFEHLSDDVEMAGHLLTKCHDLYVVTPYRETLCVGTEHVNSYDEDHYRTLGPYEHTVFASRGWSQYGWNLWVHTYLKNTLRPLLGKRIARRRKQIMFHFYNGHRRGDDRRDDESAKAIQQAAETDALAGRDGQFRRRGSP